MKHLFDGRTGRLTVRSLKIYEFDDGDRGIFRTNCWRILKRYCYTLFPCVNSSEKE